MKEIQNESIKNHTTFGVEAKASVYIEYQTVEELKRLIMSGKLSDKKVMQMGGGSNLLFCGDYDGIVLHSRIRGIDEVGFSDDEVMIKAGAGETWDDVVKMCVEKGYYGAENLSIIPGEVGASPVQNIGAYGVEAKDIIDHVECIDLTTAEEKTLTNEECRFGYRDSIFKRDEYKTLAVTYVYYHLSKKPVFKLEYGNIKSMLEGKDVTLKTVREAVISIRESKLPDPKKKGNAGSYFRNPVVETKKAEELLKEYPDMPHYNTDKGTKIPAAWLIDKSGWKGRRKGNAAVDDKQPLVIVNYTGDATSEEVKEIAEAVQIDVKKKFGIEIHPEVIYVE